MLAVSKAYTLLLTTVVVKIIMIKREFQLGSLREGSLWKSYGRLVRGYLDYVLTPFLEWS